jgi:uncharacterized protein (TIRG00374 family)
MRMSKFIMGVFLLGGIALLGWMVKQVGIRDLLACFQIVGFWLVPFFLLEIIPDLLHTAGWAACFQGYQRRLRLWQLYGIRLAGSAINQVTPTAALGGEVVKVLLLEPTLPRAQATAAVIIDKASIALAQIFYLTFGLVYALGHLPLSSELQWTLGLTTGLIFLGLLGFIASQRYGLLSKVVSRVSRLKYAPPKLHQLSQHVAPLDAQLMAYYTTHPWRFGGSLLLHVAAFVCAGSKTYVLLRLLLGHRAPGWFEALMLAMAVTALDQMFFLVPARLGTLEGTRVLVLSAVGITKVVGLTFGLIARLDSLFWNGIGLLIYVLCTRRTFLAQSRRPPSASSPTLPPSVRAGED